MFCIRVNPQFRLLATRKSWHTSGFKLPVCSCQIWSLLCRLPVKLLWLAQKKLIPISTSKSFSTVMYFIILFSFFFFLQGYKIGTWIWLFIWHWTFCNTSTTLWFTVLRLTPVCLVLQPKRVIGSLLCNIAKLISWHMLYTDSGSVWVGLFARSNL